MMAKGKTVEFLNGSRQRIHFFASRLKYSRWVRVSLVKDEKVETLVRTLAEHLASWGGRPLLCVFDRPKTIALKWRKNGEVTEWSLSGMACWRRLRDWQQAGIWQLIHFSLLDWLARYGQIDWSRAVVDGSSFRAVLGGTRRGRIQLTGPSWAASAI